MNQLFVNLIYKSGTKKLLVLFYSFYIIDINLLVILFSYIYLNSCDYLLIPLSFIISHFICEGHWEWGASCVGFLMSVYVLLRGL